MSRMWIVPLDVTPLNSKLLEQPSLATLNVYVAVPVNEAFPQTQKQAVQDMEEGLRDPEAVFGCWSRCVLWPWVVRSSLPRPPQSPHPQIGVSVPNPSHCCLEAAGTALVLSSEGNQEMCLRFPFGTW